MEILFLLGAPLAGAAALAVLGGRRWAPELGVGASLATFLAAVALTARVIRDGPMLVYYSQFFIDSFKVVLVALTSLVALTTAIFSRPYMRIEADRGKVKAGALRLYYAMFQVFTFTMLLALTTNNMGILWVAMEAA